MQFHDYSNTSDNGSKPKLHVNIPPAQQLQEEQKTPKKGVGRGKRKTQLIEVSTGSADTPTTPKTPQIDDSSGIYKRKKFRATFPMARIKRIMQADDDVGKIANAVPVMISKCLELFISSLVNRTKEITKAKNSKTMSLAHLKECIETTEQFNFLEEKVKNIQVQTTPSETTPKPKRQRKAKEPKEGDEQPKKRGRKKKVKEEEQEEDEEEDEEDGDEDSEHQKSMMSTIPFNVPQQQQQSPQQQPQQGVLGGFQPSQSPTGRQLFHAPSMQVQQMKQSHQPDTPRPGSIQMFHPPQSPTSHTKMPPPMASFHNAPASPTSQQHTPPQFKPPPLNSGGSSPLKPPPMSTTGVFAPLPFNAGAPLAPPPFTTGNTGFILPPGNSPFATKGSPFGNFGGNSPIKPPTMGSPTSFPPPASPKNEAKQEK
jgi:histone H3/H4